MPEEKKYSEKVQKEVDFLRKMSEFNIFCKDDLGIKQNNSVSFYANFLSDEDIYTLDAVNNRSGKGLLRIQSRLDILDL